MWRRMPAALMQRGRTPFSHLRNNGNQQQWANSLHAAGENGAVPLYAEVVPSELLGLSLPQAVPPGGEAGEAGAGAAAGDAEGDPAEEGPLPEGARATVLVNGVQALSCPLPEEGTSIGEAADAEEALNVMGDHGGTTLDLYFSVYTAAGELGARRRWSGVLLVRCEGEAERRIELGVVGGSDPADLCSHIATHVGGPPIASLQIEVSALETPQQISSASEGVPTSELRLVGDVVSILENPRHNPHRGSLASVLLNNKAKEVPLYDSVVQVQYSGCWLDFLRAHQDALTVFRYTERDVRQRRLAPLAKAGDARVSLSRCDRGAVAEADEWQAEQVRRQEAAIRDFVVGVLRGGELSQSELIDRLRDCEEFCDTLTPTSALLQRFLQRHSKDFLWSSAPDMPTRVGLARGTRYPHRSKHSDFSAAAAAASRPRAQQPRPSSVPAAGALVRAGSSLSASAAGRQLSAGSAMHSPLTPLDSWGSCGSAPLAAPLGGPPDAKPLPCATPLPPYGMPLGAAPEGTPLGELTVGELFADSPYASTAEVAAPQPQSAAPDPVRPSGPTYRFDPYSHQGWCAA
eukprot:TRINITY_DN10167_c1_g1_i2.p1 TRINITY_DN10167_c1_g1~~TRINITY_DN10167_c1_g1_i2.p1  ORF type:complete len:575 (+),score=180.49 TRINITY_DN10167_c1_g1_i2:116-1840(+)